MSLCVYFDVSSHSSGDKHGEWQTLEGLGAVSFNQNQIAEASKLFQQALSVLKSSNESNSSANQRILAKLANTVDIQPGRTLDTIHSVPVCHLWYNCVDFCYKVVLIL